MNDISCLCTVGPVPITAFICFAVVGIAIDAQRKSGRRKVYDPHLGPENMFRSPKERFIVQITVVSRNRAIQRNIIGRQQIRSDDVHVISVYVIY